MFATADFARTLTGLAGAALLAGTCLVGAVAPAAAAVAPTTIVVSAADLNLATAEGRAVRDARIAAAAKSVCRIGGDDLATRRAEKSCMAAAVARG